MKKYAIDFNHSTIDFSVRQMMVSKIYGESYNAEIAMSDIEQMEDVKYHLQSQLLMFPQKTLIVMSSCIFYFFNADIYPKNLFTSTYIEN
ncbi:hypothetical protein ACQKNC_11765 [Lysinibacillus sp. NPDC094177]|uniref:hypothetical protein n=1 Tax=Lysinibacillus sp. NPDC094177 TaxID=3390580 RepID=UPI003D052412